MTEICNYFNIREPDVAKIVRSADADKDGMVDFTEFITAAYDKRKLLSQDRLKAAFDTFDKDGDGYISCEELKQVLGGSELMCSVVMTSEDNEREFWENLVA